MHVFGIVQKLFVPCEEALLAWFARATDDDLEMMMVACAPCEF